MPEVAFVHPHDFTVLEILKETRDRVEHGWCQHVPAVRRDGQPCATQSPSAVRFCLAGALWRGLWDRGLREGVLRDELGVLTRYLKGLLPPPDLRGSGMVAWNDAVERQQTQVVALLELGITCLK